MKEVLSLLLVGVICTTQAYADQQDDAFTLLQKMAVAAKKLNYTGTFTYQSGNKMETSRVIHMVDATGEQEKLEVLDGSPREVVRNNEEVKCFLPDEKLVIIEQRGLNKSFPAVLPATVSELAEHYVLRLGGISRIAGLESQLLILVPKDSLRYGRELWAEIGSDLILKSRTVNDRGQTVEQFAFNQIQINAPLDREALKSHFSENDGSWRISNARPIRSLAAGNDWIFKTVLPGFKKSSGMKRQIRGDRRTEAIHFMLTDGLASISVFIEPGAGHDGNKETYSAGATNIYKRVVGNHQLTILGEVPMTTLIRLGNGMELGKK